jgi:hypothetical protein
MSGNEETIVEAFRNLMKKKKETHPLIMRFADNMQAKFKIPNMKDTIISMYKTYTNPSNTASLTTYTPRIIQLIDSLSNTNVSNQSIKPNDKTKYFNHQTQTYGEDKKETLRKMYDILNNALGEMPAPTVSPYEELTKKKETASTENQPLSRPPSPPDSPRNNR